MEIAAFGISLIFSVRILRVVESKLAGKFMNSFKSDVQLTLNYLTPFSKRSKDLVKSLCI